MRLSLTVRTALPLLAPAVALLALPAALLLGSGSAHAMDASTDTAARVFSITASAPGVSHALDGDVVTVFGHVDDRIEKRRLIAALERVDGVEHVISIIKTN